MSIIVVETDIELCTIKFLSKTISRLCCLHNSLDEKNNDFFIVGITNVFNFNIELSVELKPLNFYTYG